MWSSSMSTGERFSSLISAGDQMVLQSFKADGCGSEASAVNENPTGAECIADADAIEVLNAWVSKVYEQDILE